jgi:GNAT superfamily N-acetyltransferase
VGGEGEGLVVRPVEDGEDNLASLLAMYERLDPADRTIGVPPASPGRRREWLASLLAGGWNLVADAGSEVAGHIAVTPATGAEPLFVIFVDGRYRDRGIGIGLVRQAIARAADRGHDTLRVNVSTGNRRAIRVCRNVAFEVVERGASELGMQLSLDEPTADRVRLPPAER